MQGTSPVFHVPGKLLDYDLSICKKRATLIEHIEPLNMQEESTVSTTPNAGSESENALKYLSEGRKEVRAAGRKGESMRGRERGGREGGRKELLGSQLPIILSPVGG